MIRSSRAVQTGLGLLLLWTIVCGTFSSLDEMFAPGSGNYPEFYSDLQHHDTEVVPHDGQPRIFMLLIDSLRYETAADKRIMPNLAKLSSQGVFAKVQPGHDGVTVPCLRAAFTGQDNFRVFGFVKNLARGEAQFKSWFDQVQARGLKSVVYTDDSFAQFGSRIDKYRSNKLPKSKATDDHARQLGALKKSLEEYRSGKYDIVIFHLTYGDHIAHRSRVGRPKYRRGFGKVDKMVADVMKAVDARDTLAVFGDHGHNRSGTHAMGMDIPTYAVFRGPGFAPNTDLGTIPIASYRYLLSWASKVSIAPDYRGGYHTAALTADAAIPPSFRAPEGHSLHIAKPSLVVRFALMVHLGLLAALWFLGWHRRSTLLLMGGVLSAVGLFMPGTMQPAASIGFALLAAAVLAPVAKALSWKARGAVLAAPLLMLLFEHWGESLALWRPTLHRWLPHHLNGYWYKLLPAAIVLALLIRARTAVWIVMGGILLLTFPTIYPYGTMVTMAWLWAVWSCAWLCESARQTGWTPELPRRLFVGLLCLAGIFIFMQYFTGIRSFNFKYHHFEALFREFKPSGKLQWLYFGALAKAITLLRPGRRLTTNLIGVGIIGVLAAYERGLLPRDSGWTLVVCGIAGLLSWRMPRLVADPAEAAHLKYMFSIASLFLSYYYFLRLGLGAYHWLSIGLAALTLGAVLVRDVNPASLRAAQLQLVLLGVMLAGWASFTWSFARVEWGFVFDWMTTEQSLKYVGALAPLIAARFVIPMLLFRRVFAFLFPDTEQEVRRGAFMLLAFKMFSLLAVTAGLGYHLPGTSIFLEGIQHLVITGLLMLALL